MGMITIIGVGLQIGDLTMRAATYLKNNHPIILHTQHIGCADWLKKNGISFQSLDYLYDSCDDFDQHADLAAQKVLEAAGDYDQVIYAVYDVRDRSVLKLMQQHKVNCSVVSGPPVEGALCAFADGATRMLEAADWENYALSAMDNALIREINSRELASEVKLKLMDCYPDETPVRFLEENGRVARIPLYDLDRMKRYDHRTCALVHAQRDITKLQRYTFDDLLRVMRVLQGPNGCPWDRAQTHESLRTFLLEETYEAIDAINEGDMDHLYDELGDLLMQVAMQSEIARQHGEFDISDATTAICEKMISRHTHIFGGDHADDPDAVLDLWMQNKMKERGQRTHTEVLHEIRRSLPALLRTAKICDKAGRAGVKCADAAILARDTAECVDRALQDTDREARVGDALFMLCALAQRLGVDPELALNSAVDRFIDRFQALERETGVVSETTCDEQALKNWNKVKL